MGVGVYGWTTFLAIERKLPFGNQQVMFVIKVRGLLPKILRIWFNPIISTGWLNKYPHLFLSSGENFFGGLPMITEYTLQSLGVALINVRYYSVLYLKRKPWIENLISWVSFIHENFHQTFIKRGILFAHQNDLFLTQSKNVPLFLSYKIVLN